MKILKIIGALVAVAFVAVLGLFGYASWKVEQKRRAVFTPPDFDLSAEVAAADAEVGRRIVMIRNGCVECHGPDLSGGIAIDDPAMGTFHGPNLTPAGLKDWTDEQIVRAIRYGIDREGRTLLFMPSFDMVDMSKSDIAAIVKYLRGLPPKETPRTEPRIGPVGKMLGVFGHVPVLFPAFAIDHARGFGEKPTEGATAEFGDYLARTSCSGCHGHDFAGGPIPGGPPEWPPAADLRLSKGDWTLEKFVRVMKTGKSSAGQDLRPPMPVALTAQMSDVELEALWRFLSAR